MLLDVSLCTYFPLYHMLENIKFTQHHMQIYHFTYIQHIRCFQNFLEVYLLKVPHLIFWLRSETLTAGLSLVGHTISPNTAKTVHECLQYIHLPNNWRVEMNVENYFFLIFEENVSKAYTHVIVHAYISPDMWGHKYTYAHTYVFI